MISNKFLFLLTIVCLSFTGYANAANVSGSSSKDLLIDFADTMLHKKDEGGGYITAISLTAQCGKKPPVSVEGGTRGIHDLTPITRDSIFQIGSITKTFVAIVILQLAAEKNIDLDDSTIMQKWFPEYPKWSHITLRQLLGMTSGIPGNSNNLPDNIFSKFTGDQYFNKIDPEKILQLTHEYPLHFKPGTQYEYSNTNYVLLGSFIKKLTHYSPELEIKKRIINPLGLKNTYFVVDKEDEMPEINKNQLVHGYAFQSKKSKPYPFLSYGADTLHYSLSYSYTAGAMVSTPDDINIFLHSIFQKNGLFNEYRKQIISLVSRKTGKPIKSPSETDRLGWGFGVIGYYWNKSHPLIYIYNGTTDGFQFAWLMDPKNQAYLSLAINSHADILGLDDALKMFRLIDENCRN